MTRSDEQYPESFSDDDDLPSPSSRGAKHAARVDPELARDIERRMAAMTARRKCNQHECTEPSTGSCDHPNHRRDAHYLLSDDDPHHPGVLDMLGLDHDYPAYTPTEKAAWLRWLGQAGPPEARTDEAA